MESNKELLDQLKLIDETMNKQKEDAECYVSSLKNSFNDMECLLEQMKDYYKALEALKKLLPQMNPESQDLGFQFTDGIGPDFTIKTDNIQLIFQGIKETAAKLEILNNTVKRIKNPNNEDNSEKKIN